MPLIDPDDPFFARAWVRWVSVIIPCFWALVEFWLGNPFWGVLFGALGGYAAWVLILRR
jgi:hypothetical protein